MERKIGEIFKFNNEWYQCVDTGFSCADCDINRDCSNPCVGACSSILRRDNKQVRFKRLEKVEEPYISADGKYCQQYQCYTTPLHNKDIVYTFSDNIVVLEIKNKEDMKKLDLKPFSLEKAKQGKPVCTRDGRKARIICFDCKDETFKIVALVSSSLGREEIISYDEAGYSTTRDRDEMLVMPPEKKEGYVNVYHGQVYNTLERAKNAIDYEDNYLKTIKIDWEELHVLGSSR